MPGNPTYVGISGMGYFMQQVGNGCADVFYSFAYN